jgi:hypothetical protein
VSLIYKLKRIYVYNNIRQQRNTLCFQLNVRHSAAIWSSWETLKRRMAPRFIVLRYQICYVHAGRIVEEIKKPNKDLAVAQAVSHRLPTSAVQFRSRMRSCWIWGGHSGTGIFSLNTSVSLADWSTFITISRRGLVQKAKQWPTRRVDGLTPPQGTKKKELRNQRREQGRNGERKGKEWHKQSQYSFPLRPIL